MNGIDSVLYGTTVDEAIDVTSEFLSRLRAHDVLDRSFNPNSLRGDPHVGAEKKLFIFQNGRVGAPIVVSEFGGALRSRVWIEEGTLRTLDYVEVMNTRLVKKDAYQVGDLTGVSKRCDWFVHCENVLNRAGTDCPRTIFLSSHRGDRTVRYFVREVLPTLRSRFNLIIAGEDFTFPTGRGDARRNPFRHLQGEVGRLLAHEHLVRAFVENLDTTHPKLSPIPLGLLPYADYHLYEGLIEAGCAGLSSRPIGCFCCHRNRTGPQWKDRKRVTKLCKTKWQGFVTHADTLSWESFRETLLASRFCICVRGGGYDPSPRAWQALLCGCIPIIRRSPLDDAYARLPVVFVDDWEPDSITPAKLERWLDEHRASFEDPSLRRNVLQMLTLDYWWNLMSTPE